MKPAFQTYDERWQTSPVKPQTRQGTSLKVLSPSLPLRGALTQEDVHRPGVAGASGHFSQGEGGSVAHFALGEHIVSTFTQLALTRPDPGLLLLISTFPSHLENMATRVDKEACREAYNLVRDDNSGICWWVFLSPSFTAPCRGWEFVRQATICLVSYNFHS